MKLDLQDLVRYGFAHRSYRPYPPWDYDIVDIWIYGDEFKAIRCLAFQEFYHNGEPITRDEFDERVLQKFNQSRSNDYDSIRVEKRGSSNMMEFSSNAWIPTVYEQHEQDKLRHQRDNCISKHDHIYCDRCRNNPSGMNATICSHCKYCTSCTNCERCNEMRRPVQYPHSR